MMNGIKTHFTIVLLGTLTTVRALTGEVAPERGPLKVFVLVGQSNMQGHAHVRTFEHVGMDSKTQSLHQRMATSDGQPRMADRVWISLLSNGGERTGRLSAGFGADENKIGPEFTFGLRMQAALKEPILIIKTAWGGKSLHTDFRSPSAGGYHFSRSQLERLEKAGKDIASVRVDKIKATGRYYRLMMKHVRESLGKIEQLVPNYDSNLGYELAGMVWFQGWNDMVDRGTYPNRGEAGGYDAYSEALTHFIRDVRRDLEVPELPFVIGVLGVGGPVAEYLPAQKRYEAIHRNFRMAMAAPAKRPEFKGTVAAVLTENYWDRQLLLLRARDASLRQKAKEIQGDEKPSRAALNALLDRLRSEAFTSQEWDALQKGVSNAEYHYLGSAKIMGQIGEGFADAMIGLMTD